MSPTILCLTVVVVGWRGGSPRMAGGIKQPRPSSPFSPTGPAFAPLLPPGSKLPSLIVLDLDNTIWTPELYTLRNLPNYASAGLPGPSAGEDVWLIDGAAAALHELATCDLWRDSKVAVASRTNKGAWAQQLLRDFRIDGRPLADLMSGGTEIYPGSKIKHFERLQAATGIPYEQMLFFDDSADGKYGNCEPVSQLGVLAAHCPDGLTSEVWQSALSCFAERTAAALPMGLVLRTDGLLTSPASRSGSGGASREAIDGLVPARIAKYMAGKRFGFVQLDGSGEQVFFHQSKLSSGGQAPRAGLSVSVRLAKDRRGRSECAYVRLPEAGGRSVVGHAPAGEAECEAIDGITLPCFSMNMPFAGLLAHGTKTIESRNHTMFAGTAGTYALLHVGQRTYPDGGKHRAILSRTGLSESEIDRLTQLPDGFGRGNVVAILELGDTRLAPLEERSTDEIQSAVCAYGSDMGKHLTTVVRAAWLREAVPNVRGRPGLWETTVPRSVIPDGWSLSQPAS